MRLALGWLGLLAAACFASWSLTGAARRYALRRAVLDVPNERSSHSTPVPRGGGIAIAIICLIGVGGAGMGGWLDGRVALALVAGGGAVAAVGWIDDRRGVRAAVRALVHVLAAGFAVLLLGGLPTLRLGATTVELGIAGAMLAIVGIVWFVNLYNFMDGIDGLAAGQAVTSGSVAALLLVTHSPGLAFAAALVAAASGGFLIWNWPPARVFMGDVSSGSLGFLFGTLAVASENAAALPLLLFVLLFGAFIFDATVTLTRRMLRGERWYSAHRSHAYQRAVQAGFRHGQVTLTILAVGVILGGLAWLVQWRAALLAPMLLIGTAILVLLYVWVERMCAMGATREPRGEMSLGQGPSALTETRRRATSRETSR